ncbi:hypothetical protein LB507_010807 [Fusarium sp. FIESC RH6]|nr:hypothetical protein LB507_010807 [Fusarium sp. FIESC RH6]
MRCLLSFACCVLLSCVFAGAAEEQQHDPTDTLEVGLVFPRNESTISPSMMMPFVFSYQNTKLVPTLQPYFIYQVYNYSNTSEPVLYHKIRHGSPNLSASQDSHFEAAYHRELNTEGKWLLTLVSGYYYCFEDPNRTFNNTYTIDANFAKLNITFTTQGPPKQVDLVAATNSSNCSSAAGLTIKIADTVKTPEGDRRSHAMESDICPLKPSAALAEKCVAVVPSAASSIAAEITTRVCRETINKAEVQGDIHCKWMDEEESLGVGIVFGGATCLAFLLGALAYIL